MPSVDDTDYTRALLAILTTREPPPGSPTDQYGTSADGIDRYDGFGRDVLVESLDIVEGEHGAELEVAFSLVLPDDGSPQIPPRGTVRMPFDPTWRELSGYDEPAAYAPLVARRVERAAHQHVLRHRAGDAWARGREEMLAALPDRATQWRLLRDGLAAEGQVTEVSPGRLQVRLRHSDRVVTVVVTPEQWEQVLAFEASDDVPLYFVELFNSHDAEERFVVFWDDTLVLSIREELPPVRGGARRRRRTVLRSEPPDADVAWHAFHPDGPRGDRPGD